MTKPIKKYGPEKAKYVNGFHKYNYRLRVSGMPTLTMDEYIEHRESGYIKHGRPLGVDLSYARECKRKASMLKNNDSIDKRINEKWDSIYRDIRDGMKAFYVTIKYGIPLERSEQLIETIGRDE